MRLLETPEPSVGSLRGRVLCRSDGCERVARVEAQMPDAGSLSDAIEQGLGEGEVRFSE